MNPRTFEGSAYSQVRESVLIALTNLYGGQLERLTRQQKLTLRAALSAYLCSFERWKHSQFSMPVDLMTDAVESVDSDAWDLEKDLTGFITQHCSKLRSADMEALIENLTSQLRTNKP